MHSSSPTKLPATPGGSMGRQVPSRGRSAWANGGESRYSPEVCIPAGEMASCKTCSCSAPCPVPTAMECWGSSGYGPLAAPLPLPPRPGDLSRCSLLLSFLAECTHTDSAPGLKSTAITVPLLSEGNVIPASPALQQPSSPCHGRAG